MGELVKIQNMPSHLLVYCSNVMAVMVDLVEERIMNGQLQIMVVQHINLEVEEELVIQDQVGNMEMEAMEESGEVEEVHGRI